MKTIKFNDDYEKLHGQTSAVLFGIKVISKNEMSKELIDYDTLKKDGSRYDLKNGDYFQLFFIGNLNIPFSTFRKINYENSSYWGCFGEKFNIEIVSDKKVKKDSLPCKV